MSKQNTFLNPSYLFLRIRDRVTGKEARSLYKALIEETAKNVELKRALNQVRHFESREERLHPFIKEAFALVSSNFSRQEPTNFLNTLGEHKLEGLFTKYGSDKETRHNYSGIYSKILEGITAPRILEIGLGSLNDFPYAGLPPGGSLRAWRAAYSDAIIIGADIDPEAVASVEELAFVVDQTSDRSLNTFVEVLEAYAPFDLIVDDGFHDPHANLRTLLKILPLLADNGRYVIEDIHESLVDMWKIIGTSMNLNFDVLDLRKDRPDVEDNVLLVFRQSKITT